MKSISLQILLFILSILLISTSCWAYSTVDGATEFNCQYCHKKWDNGTSWHTDHTTTYEAECDDCHIDYVTVDNVPVDNCKSCHTDDDPWEGKPLSHVSDGNCTDCHTEVAEGCPAESALGPDSRSIDTLKRFRDKILSKNASGRAMIRIYYSASPLLTRAVNSSLIFKQMTVRLIDAIIPLIETTLKKE